MEGGNIIGLFDVTGGGAISLEPGGQFELSGAPVETVHQTCAELMAHLAQVREVATPLGIGFLGLGMTPNWTRADMPVMPKGRYRIMTNYMPKVGTLRPRHDVPHLHGADQSRLLVRSRHGQEAARVARAAAGRAPRCSPIRRSPKASRTAFCRSAREIWRDTDNARAGMLPWAFEDGMGFERWVDYALDVPMYFVKRGDNYIDVSGQSFRDLLRRQAARPAGRARRRMSDWANHLSTIFPGGAAQALSGDARRRRRAVAPAAGAAGVLGRPALRRDRLDAAWDIVKGWTARSGSAARRRSASRLQGDDQGALYLRSRQGVPGAGAFGIAPARPHRPRRPRRDALSGAARPDYRCRPHVRPKRCSAKFNGSWERLGRSRPMSEYLNPPIAF